MKNHDIEEKKVHNEHTGRSTIRNNKSMNHDIEEKRSVHVKQQSQ